MTESLVKKTILLTLFILPLFCFSQNKAENKPTAHSSEGAYGYISFTILPGFKSIRLDRETVVGMSEMILVPEGSHWIEITSPEGYADSSFKISVLKGEVVKKEIHLRNEVSGQFAVATNKKKKKSNKGKIKNILMYTSFAIGGLSALAAASEEGKTKDAREVYENATTETADDAFNTMDTHARQRDGLGAISVLSLGLGLVLWFF